MPRLDRGSSRLPSLPGLAGPRSRATFARIDPSLPTFNETDKSRSWLRPPEWWEGSPAEWAIYWAHRSANPPRGEEGVMWNFQVPLFGSFLPAGFIPDFSEYDVNVTININEEDSSQQIERYRAAILFSLRPPYTHVIIDEEDAMSNPVFFLNEALAGRTHSTFGQLI